jgi:hypothetical protein
MNTDGSGKTLVLTGPGADGLVEPSHDLHGGVRWFLTLLDVAGETYPDGLPRREVYAVSTAGGQVQITEDPTLQAFKESSLPLDDTYLRWTSGDLRISFLARRWGVDPETGAAAAVVEQGIYAVDLAADVALSPAAAVPYRLPFDLEIETDGSLGIDGMDWSPDGSQLAYCNCNEIFIVDPTSGAKTRLPLGSIARCFAHLRWSPTEEKLSVCDTPYVVRTFALDGSGDTVILQSDNRRGTIPNFVIWSPSGANIVFREHLAPKQVFQPWDGRLKRATASGTNQVILTEPSSDFAYPLGWRR